MAKINQEEYEVLKELDNKWKWIARTESRAVKTFLSKPRKRLHWLFDGSGSWDIKGNENFGIYTNYADLFQFIQWEDENPYDIAELIEEYESEETEVKKDIEWLYKSIEELPLAYLGFSVLKNKGEYGVPKDEVLSLINQLDEPEVLSREWISENVEYAYFDMLDGSGRLTSAAAIIKPKKLQNLLVPKQEEVTHKQVEKYLLDKNIRVIDIDIYEEMQSELEELKNGVTLSKTETVADVVTTFWKSYERLKEVMSMEVEELEE